MEPFYIDPDIRKAETLPASFYRSDEIFEKLKRLKTKSMSIEYVKPGRSDRYTIHGSILSVQERLVLVRGVVTDLDSRTIATPVATCCC